MKIRDRVREYVYVSGRYLHPNNAREINNFKSSLIFESRFEMVLEFDILEFITSKTFIHLLFFLWDNT